MDLIKILNSNYAKINSKIKLHIKFINIVAEWFLGLYHFAGRRQNTLK